MLNKEDSNNSYKIKNEKEKNHTSFWKCLFYNKVLFIKKYICIILFLIIISIINDFKKCDMMKIKL